MNEKEQKMNKKSKKGLHPKKDLLVRGHSKHYIKSHISVSIIKTCMSNAGLNKIVENIKKTTTA
jgi:hypothetical protein